MAKLRQFYDPKDFPCARPSWVQGSPWGIVELRAGQWYACRVLPGYDSKLYHPIHTPRMAWFTMPELWSSETEAALVASLLWQEEKIERRLPK